MAVTDRTNATTRIADNSFLMVLHSFSDFQIDFE